MQPSQPMLQVVLLPKWWRGCGLQRWLGRQHSTAGTLSAAVCVPGGSTGVKRRRLDADVAQHPEQCCVVVKNTVSRHAGASGSRNSTCTISSRVVVTITATCVQSKPYNCLRIAHRPVRLSQRVSPRKYATAQSQKKCAHVQSHVRTNPRQ